ncbi:peptidoglycan/xylan/chitin deacetylase (PgdA/CDA1 family) [Microbacterium trichothecenolyticum]|uniref:polysaccharide deacetylase family protein n=1 Tax=Microbacterium trichothecenolyticum TaxID=69370 RepID=UPI002856A9E8|nr:polysaccharide deacetylase family protein [Microbacterium trichothecenolyticum]MDR7185137.1 peptidoglycan/xylan/chitin deacetylase (PgdA/CDA1 family) [Microbacterium trichothecenolyticum]
MRARWMVAALAAAVLALSACAPASRGGWDPPAWAPEVVHATDPVPEISAAADGPLGAGIVPLRVRNDAVGLQARVALLPAGATTDAFNAQVEQFVRGAIADRVVASGTAFVPTPSSVGSGLGDRRCASESTRRPAAELLADPAFGPVGGAGTAVVCGIVAAGGTIVGERVRVLSGDAAGVHSDTATTLYTDVATGETATADGLWAEGAAAALGAHIVEALRRDAGALSHRPVVVGDETQIAAIQTALGTTVPSDEGLVITLAPGFTAPDLAGLGAPPTTEPTEFAIPAEVAADLVSPLGARVLASSDQPYTGPVAAPAGTRAVDCDLVPCVALTYDDGPSSYTPGILDELAARDAAATFFAMGQNAQGYADTLARMTREGHEVEGHTWNHPHLPQLTDAQVTAQVVDSTQALEAVSGQDITVFRPPYGEFTPRVLAAAGMPAILWDIDTNDWQGPADDVLNARAVEQPRAGSIVLLHDVHAVTARTAGAVLDGLLDRGFQLVTVRQLFGGELPTSGSWRRAP